MAKKLYGAAAAAHAKKHGHRRSKKRRSHSKAMVRTRTRTVTVRARRRGGKHSGGGMKLTHLAIASAGLAFITSSKSPVSAVKDLADKIPGSKTFGPEAMLGVAALAVDRFIKPNKWLKLLGTAGIVLAAVKIGTQGTDFKFLGDNDDVGGYDIEGDDDMGDDDMGDDDMGDDE